MTKDEKAEFMRTASPQAIVEKFPREYTLQMRMGPSKWHMSASRMTPLEVQMYDLANGVYQLEEFVKQQTAEMMHVPARIM